MFDRTTLISLPRRQDRRDRLASDWPLNHAPQVFEAVDGGALPLPREWKQGPGAWGAMQSHRRVMEQAIIDGVESLFVFEDDVVFIPGFTALLSEFYARLPDDWEGVYLGGQHVQEPTWHSIGVLRSNLAIRFHAYGLRGDFLREAYRKLVSSPDGHCDWIVGTMHPHYRVYCPERFLCGQAASRSDTSGDVSLNDQYWQPPTSAVFVLDVVELVAAELRRRQFVFLDDGPLGLAERIRAARRDLAIQVAMGRAHDVLLIRGITAAQVRAATGARVIETTGKTADELTSQLDPLGSIVDEAIRRADQSGAPASR